MAGLRFQLRRLAESTLLVALGACAVQEPLLTSEPRPPAWQDAPGPCKSGMVLLSGQQVGTFFKLQRGGLTAYLTASHVLQNGKLTDVTLKSVCGTAVQVERLDAVEALSGLDAALLRPRAPMNAVLALQAAAPEAGQPVVIAGWPMLAALDSNLAELLVPARGELLRQRDAMLYFKSEPLLPGISGAPVVAADGRVIGMLGGRLRDGGQYTGIAYGTSIQSIVDKLSAVLPARTDSQLDAPPGDPVRSSLAGRVQ